MLLTQFLCYIRLKTDCEVDAVTVMVTVMYEAGVWLDAVAGCIEAIRRCAMRQCGEVCDNTIR